MEQKIFFVGDTHFNHVMLVREKKRRFSTVEEMNNAMIEGWNKKVSEGDLVYHLGDIALNKKVDYEKNILPQLKGNIIFIQGNHDQKNISITQNIIIKFFGILIELVHRPYDATKKTKLILHGHIHKSGYQDMPFKGDYIKDHIFKDLDGRFFYNCNLEYHKYKPKLLNEILGEIQLIKNKQKEDLFNIIKKETEIHISDLLTKLPGTIRQAEVNEIIHELEKEELVKKEHNSIFILKKA